MSRSGALSAGSGSSIQHNGVAVTGAANFVDLTLADLIALGAVPKTLVDAKGDLLVGSADNVLVRLGAGTSNQVLTVQADGSLAWATPAAGVSDGGVLLATATGKFATLQHATRTTSAGLSALSQLELYPLSGLPPTGPLIDAMAMEVATAGAGNAARLGIYERTSGTTFDFTLLAEMSATIDCSTIGLKTATAAAAVAHAGKRLWVAYVPQGGTVAQFRAFNIASMTQIPVADPSGTAPPTALRVTGVAGALPATLTDAQVTTSAPLTGGRPIVWVRGA